MSHSAVNMLMLLSTLLTAEVQLILFYPPAAGHRCL